MKFAMRLFGMGSGFTYMQQGGLVRQTLIYHSLYNTNDLPVRDKFQKRYA
jgi:hypothetical protein